jgi:hypothetical protein
MTDPFQTCVPPPSGRIGFWHEQHCWHRQSTVRPGPAVRGPQTWPRGTSAGRPPAPVDIAALAREHGPECIEVAAKLFDDPDPKMRLAACLAEAVGVQRAGAGGSGPACR